MICGKCKNYKPLDHRMGLCRAREINRYEIANIMGCPYFKEVKYNMPISDRMLKKWRRESLIETNKIDTKEGYVVTMEIVYDLHTRILRMTQELLDKSLIER